MELLKKAEYLEPHATDLSTKCNWEYARTLVAEAYGLWSLYWTRGESVPPHQDQRTLTSPQFTALLLFYQSRRVAEKKSVQRFLGPHHLQMLFRLATTALVSQVPLLSLYRTCWSVCPVASRKVSLCLL
jgi:hypothetical protein